MGASDPTPPPADGAMDMEALADALPTIEAEKELPVTVALMMRPLVGPELVDGCRECVFPNPEENSVTLVSEHKFTYDHVFHGPGPTEKALYEQCVEPLVRGLVCGYNATVLAYGQTGSGKTHCMGTSHEPGGATEGVIPRVMQTLFRTIADEPPEVSVKLKVGFIEIHKEDIRDLLVTDLKNAEAVSLRENVGRGQNGGVSLVGAKEVEVSTAAEMAAALASGSAARATAATGMNHRSSRSHAIFTIHVERRGRDPADVTRAKMHLVDLAGSERAKRTKAEGQRLKEGIQINKGLLALGNVISALGDDKRRHAGGHVPYRDSKLTRLLQDSLGGNSRTVMVACISPADANLDETMSTLKYANRARNIINKTTVNFDEGASKEVARLRRALSAARAEVAKLRVEGVGPGTRHEGDGFAPGSTCAKLDAMEARALCAEAEAARLRADVVAAEEAAAASQANELAATVERDRLRLKLEDAGSNAEDDGGTNVIRGYLSTIQALRSEQQRLKHQLAAAYEGRSDPYGEDPAASYDIDDDAAADPYDDDDDADIDEEEDDIVDDAEDAANDELQAELAGVERDLRAKEARMRAMSSAARRLQAEVDSAVKSQTPGAAPTPGTPMQDDVEELREKYGRLLASLESEKSELAAERDALAAELADAAKHGEDIRLAVESKNRGRMAELEKRLKEVQRLAAKHQEAARLREKSDQAAKALQADIQRLRAARVDLVRRMEKAAKEGVNRQREAERALQAARKDGRRHAAAAQKAQAAVDRQVAVLRRKTEEAASAREQLRALQTAAKANSRKKTAAAAATAATAPAAAAAAAAAGDDKAGTGTGLGLAERKAWIENEIASAVERSELRAALEESLAQRAALGRRFPHLASPGKASFSTPSSNETSQYDAAVEEEMRAVTEQIAALQERLYRSEEREETRGGMRRWQRVRSLGEARSLLVLMFNAAAAARKRVNAVNGEGAAPGELLAALPALKEAMSRVTPGGDVVAEADAVLRQLKKKTGAGAKKQPATRPPWQAVGPSSLSASPAEDEAKPEKKKSAPTFLDDDDMSESDSEGEDEAAANDPEWDETCVTPAVVGGRGKKMKLKKPACTACASFFDTRVEGHQKSHKRCPFFSLYVLEKDMKQLEEAEGAGAEEQLEMKKAEYASEKTRLEAAVAAGAIAAAAPLDDATPGSDAGSASAAASNEKPGPSTVPGGVDVESAAAPATQTPSALIDTCRNARRRAEGLLRSVDSGDGGARSRSPFGDVSNGGGGPSVAVAEEVRKRMSFGGSGAGGFGGFAASGVTMGRGKPPIASSPAPMAAGAFLEPTDEMFSATVNADDL